jgi:hypothetical protein
VLNFAPLLYAFAFLPVFLAFCIPLSLGTLAFFAIFDPPLTRFVMPLFVLGLEALALLTILFSRLSVFLAFDDPPLAVFDAILFTQRL